VSFLKKAQKKPVSNKRSKAKKRQLSGFSGFLDSIPGWVYWAMAAGGWILGFWALLALQDFQTVVKTYFWVDKPNRVPLAVIITCLSVGFVLLAVGLRRLPFKEKVPELDRRIAYPVLAVIMAGAAYLCLYRMDRPPGSYWDDWANNLVLVRLIIDTGLRGVMLPFGGREGFYPYLMTGMRALFPEWDRIVVHRMTSCVVDLLTVWVLYRVGREASSRRAGLIAAAVGAASKPMLILYLAGLRACSTALAVSLLMLTVLRVMKKPTPGRFLQWGLAMAFGLHTYSVFRPFMMFVPILMLGWVLLRKEDRSEPAAWGASFGALILLAGIFGDMFGSIHPAFEGFAKSWGAIVGNGWLFLLFVVLTMGLAVWAYVRTGKGRGFTHKMAGWSLGLGFACLLAYPISRTVGFNARLGVLSVFRMRPEAMENEASFLVAKLGTAFQRLFWYANERADLIVSFEPFYDMFTQGVVLLGVAWALSRWDFRRFLLLAMGGLGIIVLVLSIDPTTLKIVASVPSLAILAACAADRLWMTAPALPWGRSAVAAFLAAFAFWGGSNQFQKLHGYWAEVKAPNTTVANLIKEDSPAHRVYLAQSEFFYGLTSQYALNDERRFYFLKDENVVTVRPGEQPEDVVVLVAEKDAAQMKRLKQQCPYAEWTRHLMNYNPGQPDVAPLYLWRVLIPGESLPKRPGSEIYIAEYKGVWTRRLYTGLYGWSTGGILRERWTDNFSEPVPLGQMDRELFEEYLFPSVAVVSGEVRLGRSGDYEWTVNPTNPCWVRLDGHTLIKTRTSTENPNFKRMHMEAGTYRLEARVLLKTEGRMPEVSYRMKGESEWTEL
jgi:hypothetical protein